MPVRSFLTNSSNKINQNKNLEMKSGLDPKHEYSPEKSKNMANKSAKLQPSGSYMKKFKSHQPTTKLSSIQNSAQSNGQSHGILNQASQHSQSHYNTICKPAQLQWSRKTIKKQSPTVKKYSQSDWQSAEHNKKYFSQQKNQPVAKQDRNILATSTSPKQGSDYKRDIVYMQKQQLDKNKFCSTQIYNSKVKCVGPKNTNGNQSLPRQHLQVTDQQQINQSQQNRMNQNRNQTLVGPMRNATISLVQQNRNYASSSNQSLDKFGSQKKSIGNLVIGSLANKFKNINKLSVKSNNSINSRFNVAQAVNGNDKRPQNNPFTDIQSFSSNGLGQILGISFKKLGGNASTQAAKCLGDSPHLPNNQTDQYGPQVRVEYEDLPVQIEDYEMADPDDQNIQKSIQNDSFDKGSMCSNMSEHKNDETSSINPAKHYLQTSSDIVYTMNQPLKKQDVKEMKNQRVRQSNIFLSYKSLAQKKGSIQNQLGPLKTYDPQQFKNALSSHINAISKPYISTSGQQPLLNKSITHQSSTNLNLSRGHAQIANISTSGINIPNSKRYSIAIPLSSGSKIQPSLLYTGQQKAEKRIARVLNAHESQVNQMQSPEKMEEKNKLAQNSNCHSQKYADQFDKQHQLQIKDKYNKIDFECSQDVANNSKLSKFNSAQKRESQFQTAKGQSNQKTQAQLFESTVISGKQTILSPKPKVKRKQNHNLNKAVIQSKMVTSGESSFANTTQTVQQISQNIKSAEKTLFKKIQQQDQYQVPLTQRNVNLIDLEQPINQLVKQKTQVKPVQCNQQQYQPESQPSLKKTNELSENDVGSGISMNQQPSSAMALPHYPMAADLAIQYFSNVLNDYEKQEIYKFDKHIYYLGQNCKKKIKGHCNTPGKSAEYIQRHKDRLKQMNIFNHGYDDEQGDYQVILKDHLGYRFEVLEFLGQGSFGQAIKCLDHKTQQKVAIKIIRNKKKFQYQAGIELKTLKYLNMQDKYDQNNIIRVNDFMVFRKHLLIAFECLSINLYEFIKNNNFQGVHQNLIRRFAIQILQALKFQRDHRIVHCDLKPENILLKQENKSGIKIIDYGSSCFIGQRIYTYIQSRFYRAPEIILGIPYSMAIDMWSFGCIIAELFTGYPIFPGENEVDQLAYIMEICGIPSKSVLDISTRRHLFFDDSNVPILMPNTKGKIRQPNAKSLVQVLIRSRPRNKGSYETEADNRKFIDFLERCFEWHPEKRMTPLEALHHEWILEGLPNDVLEHHLKMFEYPGQPQDNHYKSTRLTQNIREENSIIRHATFQEIQGFPPNAQTKSIYEIVGEIRREDQEREKRKLHRERKSTEEQVYKHKNSKDSVDANRNLAASILQKKQIQPQDAEIKALSSSTSLNKQLQPLKSSTFKATKKFSQTQPSSSYTAILRDPELLHQNSVVQYQSPQKQRLTLQKKSEQIGITVKPDHQFQTEQRHLEKIELMMSNSVKRIKHFVQENNKDPNRIAEKQYKSTSKKQKEDIQKVKHSKAHIDQDVEEQRMLQEDIGKGFEQEEDGEDTIEDDIVELSRLQPNSSSSFVQANHGSHKNNQSKRGDMISQRMELQSRIIQDQVYAQHNSPTANANAANPNFAQEDPQSMTINHSNLQPPTQSNFECPYFLNQSLIQGQAVDFIAKSGKRSFGKTKERVNPQKKQVNLEFERHRAGSSEKQMTQRHGQLEICQSSSSSDMMMDMSECAGVVSSASKDVIPERQQEAFNSGTIGQEHSNQNKPMKSNQQKMVLGPKHSIKNYGQQAHPRLMPTSGPKKQTLTKGVQVSNQLDPFQTTGSH